MSKFFLSTFLVVSELFCVKLNSTTLVRTMISFKLISDLFWFLAHSILSGFVRFAIDALSEPVDQFEKGSDDRCFGYDIRTPFEGVRCRCRRRAHSYWAAWFEGTISFSLLILFTFTWSLKNTNFPLTCSKAKEKVVLGILCHRKSSAFVWFVVVSLDSNRKSIPKDERHLGIWTMFFFIHEFQEAILKNLVS